MPILRRLTRIERWRRAVDDELESVNRQIRGLARQLRRQGKNFKSGFSGRTATGLTPQADAELAGTLGRRFLAPERPPVPADAGRESRREIQQEFAGLRAEVERASQAERHERFIDYLASNFDSSRPLRHERSQRRNKAIVMLVFIGVIVLWFLWRHYL